MMAMIWKVSNFVKFLGHYHYECCCLVNKNTLGSIRNKQTCVVNTMSKGRRNRKLIIYGHLLEWSLRILKKSIVIVIR